MWQDAQNTGKGTEGAFANEDLPQSKLVRITMVSVVVPAGMQHNQNTMAGTIGLATTHL